MEDSIADLLQVGDRVMVDCIDGFGGPARVVEVRNGPLRCKVQMDDRNPGAAFWAHNAELSPMPTPEGEPYDSRPDTLLHILEVRRRLAKVIKEFRGRWCKHDLSKLVEPEKSAFDTYTPKLRDTTYGTEEYEGYRQMLGEALTHHYAEHRHHPEHHPDGVYGMNLIDLIECLVDWKAATLRHHDGDLRKSIEINQKRFGYSDELKGFLTRTAEALGFFDEKG